MIFVESENIVREERHCGECTLFGKWGAFSESEATFSWGEHYLEERMFEQMMGFSVIFGEFLFFLLRRMSGAIVVKHLLQIKHC